MPMIQEVLHQLQMDRETKQALGDHQDVESSLHTIEHHFVTNRNGALEDLVQLGVQLGFDSSDINIANDADGAAYWYCDILSESPTYIHTMHRESLLMLALAEAVGVTYDGWGTLIAKPK